jgi:PPOX class probable F420-dependent enzyme
MAFAAMGSCHRRRKTRTGGWRVGEKFVVRGVKDARGWKLRVDGVGVTRSDTLTGAEAAVRSFLRQQIGPRADGAKLDLTPKAGSLDLAGAMECARRWNRSVLVTVRRDGRPQLSNVSHLVSGEAILVPTAAGRAKVPNLRRDPRVSLYLSPEPYTYVVIDGVAEVSAPAVDVDDPILDTLIELHRIRNGEAEDWDAFRRARLAESRVIIRISPSYAYGMGLDTQ